MTDDLFLVGGGVNAQPSSGPAVLITPSSKGSGAVLPQNDAANLAKELPWTAVANLPVVGGCLGAAVWNE